MNRAHSILLLSRLYLNNALNGKSSLYINCVNFKKAFDSIYRTVLWKLLSHYGFYNITKNMYEGFSNHVIFKGQFSEGFQVGNGVRQNCLLYPLLFLIAIDWTMKRSTEHHRLRYILKVWWPNKISNKNLWKKSNRKK